MKLVVERLGYLGDGIAQGPDGVVLVPMALPGEEVEGAVEGGRMVNPRIVTPAPERVRAPCPHYRACGACALQHAADDFVAAWKTDVVRNALAAQGLEAPFRPGVTSPARSRRRAVFSGRRTKADALVGYHGRASDVIVPVAQCLVNDPRIMAGLPALTEITRIGTSRKAEIGLGVTISAAGLDIAVTGGKPMDAALFSDLAALAEGHDLARVSWDGAPVVTRAAPVQRFGKAGVTPPAGAFLQATREGEAALLAAVREGVGPSRRVADLFAGCGTFALPLCEQAEVHAVEGDKAMTDAMVAGWRQSPGLHRLTAEARDLFRRPLLPDELNRCDAVVIDPPRAGCEAQVGQIVLSKVPVVVAVSCNPVTFARDARHLVDAGFGLKWVQVVDQFRWSTHVELVSLFTRD